MGFSPAEHARGVLKARVPLPLRVDTVLFDMDGVLVDVSGSYRRAIQETVRVFTGLDVAAEQIQSYKNRGGFNDDWRLTATLIADAGFDVSFPDVVAEFQRRYRGDRFDGLISGEPSLIEPGTLEGAGSLGPMALVTGRPEEEARWTLHRFGWEGHFPVVVAMEHQAGRGKPDPFPIRLALDALAHLGHEVSPGRAVYIGDTVDDMKAAVAAGIFGFGVVPPYLAGTLLAEALFEAGADVVTADVNALAGVLEGGL
jgi:HAD superfamily phosphatase